MLHIRAFSPGDLVDKHLRSSCRSRAVPRRRVSGLQPTLIEAGRPVHWPRKGDLGGSPTASITAGVEKKVLDLLQIFILEMMPTTMK